MNGLENVTNLNKHNQFVATHNVVANNNKVVDDGNSDTSDSDLFDSSDVDDVKVATPEEQQVAGDEDDDDDILFQDDEEFEVCPLCASLPCEWIEFHSAIFNDEQ